MNIVLGIDYLDPRLKIQANLVPKLKCPQCLRILTLRTNIYKLFLIQNLTQNSRFGQIWSHVSNMILFL